MLGVQMKQPADQRDYGLDFSPWLPDGDLVTTAEATVSPAYDPVDNPDGVQIESTQLNGLEVKVWLSGGVSGKTYKITVVAATAGGRVKEVDFQLRVKDC
jgi:hypothetical protein